MLVPLSGVTFLLGSGVSIPSGYPSTAGITSNLLSKNWLGDRDRVRRPSPFFDPTADPTYALKLDAVIGLVRILRSHIDQHLALHGKDEASYEDIYYLARQLLDGTRGEYDNPALLPLMFDLRNNASFMVEKLNDAYRFDGVLRQREELRFESLLERSLDFVEESVATQLASGRAAAGLDLLDKMMEDDPANPLQVVTLNHDTLLDCHFAKHSVVDGFRPFSSGTELFDPIRFELQTPFRVMLLKLHGSVDWFRYKSNKGTDLAIKVKGGDRDHIKGEAGEDLRSPENRLLLAGTTNKELAYGSGIFLELMFQFHHLLKQTRLLIVSGYGFGDKGINNRLWAWLDERGENRLLVLHAEIQELHRKAKPSFAFNMTRHKEAKKFLYVEKWLCDCTPEDIHREVRMAQC